MSSSFHVTPLANSSVPPHIMIPIEECIIDFVVVDINNTYEYHIPIISLCENEADEFTWDDACALECAISIAEECLAD